MNLKTRKTLTPFFLGAAFTVGGCAAPMDPATIAGEMTITESEVGALHIAPGAEVLLDTEALTVNGDLLIDAGARVETLRENLDLVVRGTLRVEGDLIAAGDLALASSADLLPTPEEREAEESENATDIVDGVAPNDAPVPAWVIQAPIQVGRRGHRGGSLIARVHGNVKIAPPEGLPTLAFPIADGEPGESMTGCSVTGGDGGRGGKLNVKVYGGTLRIANVAFTGGNGGAGGTASGSNCENGSVNRGGVGGKSGSFAFQVVRVRSSDSMEMGGSVTFDGWNAGDGGPAGISGKDGVPGASVTAKSGRGEDVKGYALRASSDVSYDASTLITMAIGNGGDGERADALGGNGLPGICQVTTGFGGAGSDAGNGEATSGRGGDVDVIVDLPAGAPFDTTASFSAGSSGSLEALGGRGGKGADCERTGGYGGRGGDAVGVLGRPGATSIGAKGESGFETEVGGDGGNGGCPGGAGGAGGSGAIPGADGLSC